MGKVVVRRGKGDGSLPDGLTRPKRMLAIACRLRFRDTRIRGSLHVLRPGHGNRSARLQHHDGVRVGCGHGGDESVLIVRQAERCRVPPLRHPLRYEYDGHLGSCRGLGCLRRVRAGIVDDSRAGSGLFADVQERRRRKVDGFFPGGWAGLRVDALPPGASTCAEPPPEITPTSAWPPMIAMLRISPGASGRMCRCFEQHGALVFDLFRVVAAAEGMTTLRTGGSSITPLENMLRTMRWTMSLSRASGTFPSCTACFSGSLSSRRRRADPCPGPPARP